MSARNTPLAKRARSLLREQRKAAAVKDMPYGGIQTTTAIVKHARYLRGHKIESATKPGFSRIADVRIAKDRVVKPGGEAQVNNLGPTIDAMEAA